jgi:hypothetical protein
MGAPPRQEYKNYRDDAQLLLNWMKNQPGVNSVLENPKFKLHSTSSSDDGSFIGSDPVSGVAENLRKIQTGVEYLHNENAIQTREYYTEKQKLAQALHNMATNFHYAKDLERQEAMQLHIAAENLRTKTEVLTEAARMSAMKQEQQLKVTEQERIRHQLDAAGGVFTGLTYPTDPDWQQGQQWYHPEDPRSVHNIDYWNLQQNQRREAVGANFQGHFNAVTKLGDGRYQPVPAAMLETATQTDSPQTQGTPTSESSGLQTGEQNTWFDSSVWKEERGALWAGDGAPTQGGPTRSPTNVNEPSSTNKFRMNFVTKGQAQSSVYPLNPDGTRAKSDLFAHDHLNAPANARDTSDVARFKYWAGGHGEGVAPGTGILWHKLRAYALGAGKKNQAWVDTNIGPQIGFTKRWNAMDMPTKYDLAQAQDLTNHRHAGYVAAGQQDNINADKQQYAKIMHSAAKHTNSALEIPQPPPQNPRSNAVNRHTRVAPVTPTESQ